jgi:hypothetical protein
MDINNQINNSAEGINHSNNLPHDNHQPLKPVYKPSNIKLT